MHSFKGRDVDYTDGPLGSRLPLATFSVERLGTGNLLDCLENVGIWTGSFEKPNRGLRGLDISGSEFSITENGARGTGNPWPGDK